MFPEMDVMTMERVLSASALVGVGCAPFVVVLGDGNRGWCWLFNGVRVVMLGV